MTPAAITAAEYLLAPSNREIREDVDLAQKLQQSA
jgi:hypothetical protein